jgi:hypothetical protein
MTLNLGSQGSTARVISVDPKLAKLWLDTVNTRNRPINKRRVAGYARAMASGRWRISNDALAFDDHGVLINGQNRLQAIVESGTTQKFLVLEGMPTEAQNIMDVGATRRPGQQLHINGWKNGSQVAAIARALLRWHGPGFGADYRPSIDEIAEFAERHAARLEVATDYAMRIGRRVEVSRALLGAFAFTAFDLSATTPERLTASTVREFLELLETGANMPADHPVMVLRDRVGRYRRERIQQSETAQLYDIVRTWNAFRKGERYSKLQSPKNGVVTPKHLALT